MPDWNEADRDEFGFPLTREGTMSNNQKMAYLLKEIVALQKRMKSLENSIGSILQKIDQS